MNGLALKVDDSGFLSAKKIIEQHIEKLKTSGKVYFSTDVSIATKMANEIDYILLFNKKREMYYLGKVNRIVINKKIGVRETDANIFVPEDAKKFSVDSYAEEKKKTWILLESLEMINDQSCFDKWETLNEGISVKQKIEKGGRFPRFYFIGEY